MLKAHWDKPDAVYALDSFLRRHRHCKTELPRKEFAALVHEAWVLLSGVAVRILYRALVQGHPTLKTRQGVHDAMLQHAPMAHLVRLKDKLVRANDLYRKMDVVRQEGIDVLYKMSEEQLAVMCGFFLGKAHDNPLHYFETLMLETHSMTQLYDLCEYVNTLQKN